MTAAAPAAAPLVDSSVFAAERVTKSFPGHVALADVTLRFPAGHVIGLLGRNGAGKTTLLHLAAGLSLPSAGACHTLGRRSDLLDSPELTRLGLVMQESRFIEWMTVAQHLEFTASFYPRWDRQLEQRLVETLEVPLKRRLGELSTGDRQKVGILLGVCHRPALLLLDEPMSSLDPIARSQMLNVLLERLREDGCTVVISSHLLEDIEKIVDWIVVLDAGRVTADAALDELLESFAEWNLTAVGGPLPARFSEPFVVAQQVRARAARLTVRLSDAVDADRFAAMHGVEIAARPLNLSEIFPLLVSAPERR